jgi:signal transduction histidine kinase
VKIRTQFHLLIAGIVLIPVFSFLSQGLYWYRQEGDAPSVVPLYEELAPMLRPAINNRDWNAIRGFVSRLRPNTEIVLFRHDLTVIYSGIEDFTMGERVTLGKINTLLHSGNTRYGYAFEAPPWLREGQIFLLLRTDREAPAPPNFVYQLIRSMLLVNFMIFAFALIMSLLIIRSISRSVLILEDATRRIAAGELDLDVKPEKTGLLRKDNEITSLTYSLNRMRLELKEEEQARSRFIMGVTHDLKTPLALIKGYAEAIRDGITAEPEAREKSLDIISGKVDQLEGMINDLINFVRLDTGEWQRRLKPVELRSFLTIFTRRFSDDAELLKRRTECTIDLPGEVFLPMDEALVTRALENLLGNALRYTPEGGFIRFRALGPDSPALPPDRSPAVILELSDNGPGIPRKDLPHIFEAFYRGDNSRRQQGMGLGLSVVKGVIDSHGWTIAASSPADSPGEGGGPGTRFTITIPLSGQ